MYSVLLVDDEPFIVDGLEILINWEELGLKVIGKAYNGQEAFQFMEHNHVDILITDIKMPKILGTKLIARAKTINPTCKYIILSGHNDFEYVKEGIKLGIDFAGGTEVQVLFADGVDVDEGRIRALAGVCGIENANVVRYGELGASEFLIRFLKESDPGTDVASECPLTSADREQLARSAEAQGREGDAGEVVDRLHLAMASAIGAHDVRRVEFVGPRVGSELRRDGVEPRAADHAAIGRIGGGELEHVARALRANFERQIDRVEWRARGARPLAPRRR